MRAILALPILASAVTTLAQVTAYAPQSNVECPDLSTAPLIRTFTPQNQTLHPDEIEYVTTRRTTVIPSAWSDWIGNGSSLGYDLTSFNASNYPNVGLAIPGGGLRSAQYGAAVMLALDARNASAKAKGTGGLLQVASYLTGLSGTPRRTDAIENEGTNELIRWFLGHRISGL